MPDGKWIPGLTADTPVVDAARRVLGVRLEIVRHYLPLAARHAEVDTEYVHQLRVATRRTAAAVRIFESYLPQKRANDALKCLRRIRRAAGAARDWDVFQATLNDWARGRPTEEAPGLDFLHGYAFDQRLNAQQELVKAGQAGLEANVVVAAVGEPADFDAPRRLGELAERSINRLLTRLDAESATAVGDFEQLHRVRIRGKRLRYAMEIFAGCFPPAFRHELYAAVERLQEILGAANDSHVAAQRIEAVAVRLRASRSGNWQRFGPGIERLLDWHQQRLPEAREHYAAWRASWETLRTSTPHWTPARTAEMESA